MSLKDLGQKRLAPEIVKDASLAYLRSLPTSEWGQMQDCATRIYGTPEGMTYWRWGDFQFQSVSQAFHQLEREGLAKYGSHLGWRAL